jgi:hypothetical protein
VSIGSTVVHPTHPAPAERLTGDALAAAKTRGLVAIDQRGLTAVHADLAP